MAFMLTNPALWPHYHNRGPSGPPTRGESILLAILLILGLIGGTAFGVWAWRDEQNFDAQTKKMQVAWDAGVGRPKAVEITPGHSATAPTSVRQISQYWDTCTYKTCYGKDIGHYPMAYPVGALELDHNCYTDNASNQVTEIWVAATRGGVYSVAFSSSGKTITICVITQQHDEDSLVIWSDDPLPASASQPNANTSAQVPSASRPGAPPFKPLNHFL